MSHSISEWPLFSAYCGRFGVPVVVVDLETTGGNMFEDRVTEVGLLRFENGSVKQYQWLVNPQQSIPSFVARLTGIDDDLVADAPLFSEIADELLMLLRGSLVVAHNSKFDYTFLRHEFQRIGIDFAAPALCTVQLSRRLYPQFFKHNLDSIIERFDIQVESRHRALSDVLVLANFLEHSLHERGVEEWENQCRSLMNPKMLPSSLSQSLAKQLYALPDRHGVLVWLDHSNQVLAIDVCEKAYAETARLLHSNSGAVLMKQSTKVRFESAVGRLHALQIKAQLMSEYGLRPSEIRQTYFTVHFAPDARGRLQARIMALKNGRLEHQPYGLFLHKKSAKRSLIEWAASEGLCPASLDILPVTYAKDVPCPKQEIGHCSGECQTVEGIAEQNQIISAAANKLPVAEWGKAHEVEVLETDGLTGKQIVLRLKGGALVMPDGSWYFDDALPMVMKSKFKQGAEVVRVLA